VYGLNTNPALPGTLEADFTDFFTTGLGGVVFFFVGVVVFLGVYFFFDLVDFLGVYFFFDLVGDLLTFFLVVLVVLVGEDFLDAVFSFAILPFLAVLVVLGLVPSPVPAIG